MKISVKECEETKYWLLLYKNSNNYPIEEGLLKKIETIQKILNKIISSAKRNQSSH